MIALALPCHRYFSCGEKAARRWITHIWSPHIPNNYCQFHTQTIRMTSMMKDQHLPQVAKPEVDAWQDGLQCVPDKNNLPEAYHPELGLDERIATPKSRNASIRRNHLFRLPKATIRLGLGLFMTATLAIVAADIIGSLLHERYFELSQAQQYVFENISRKRSRRLTYGQLTGSSPSATLVQSNHPTFNLKPRPVQLPPIQTSPPAHTHHRATELSSPPRTKPNTMSASHRNVTGTSLWKTCWASSYTNSRTVSTRARATMPPSSQSTPTWIQAVLGLVSITRSRTEILISGEEIAFWRLWRSTQLRRWVAMMLIVRFWLWVRRNGGRRTNVMSIWYMLMCYIYGHGCSIRNIEILC